MTKVSIWRAVWELAAYTGVSVYAFTAVASAPTTAPCATMTTPELGVAVTAIGGVVGVIVWLVRLEGRINTQGEILARVEAHVSRIADGGHR